MSLGHRDWTHPPERKGLLTPGEEGCQGHSWRVAQGTGSSDRHVLVGVLGRGGCGCSLLEWGWWRGCGVDMAWTLECESELTGGPLRPVMGLQGEAGASAPSTPQVQGRTRAAFILSWF